MMKTLETIATELKSKGINFEINYPQSNIRMIKDIVLSTSTMNEIQIGIEVKPYIWAWFEVSNYNDKLHFSFLQRYNCNTGTTIKSWNTGFNIRLKLKEQSGIDLLN